MTFTSNSPSTRFFNYSKDVDVVNSTITVFKALSIDDQLAVLWYAYTEMGKSITPAATGSARLQLAEGLLNKIKEMSHPEQLNHASLPTAL
ncbi:MAG: orange carotenoid protein, partial [Sphaerospermopsis sp. SIO1G2]|nr:orange carotenoid protein [Sphaerospermopsis sp. SIO1G2]